MEAWIIMEMDGMVDEAMVAEDVAVEVEGVVAVIQVVDHHLDDVLLIDSRDQLGVREGRGTVSGRIAQMREEA